MRGTRTYLVACGLALATAGAVGAAEAGPEGDGIEPLVRQIEALVYELTGDAPDLANVRSLGDGFYSLTVPVEPEGAAAGWQAAAANGKLIVLAVGHTRGTPRNPTSIGTALSSNRRSLYNFWWAVYSSMDEEVERRSTHTVAGPRGFRQQKNGMFAYGPDSITIHWFGSTETLPELGVYQERVKVVGTRARRAFFVVEGR